MAISFTLKYKKTDNLTYLREYAICEGYHLFEIHADYARRSSNGCTYYVVELNARRAKERFKNLLSWMSIYSVAEVMDKNKSKTVLTNPDKFIIL